LLDHNVDARCARVLKTAGHECWTAAEAGRPDATDADLAVYADDRGAVLVTHDREFTEWRERNTIGQHVRLDCQIPDGPEFIAANLAIMIHELTGRPNIVLTIRHGGRFYAKTDWQ
jgi:hypothetical protein